jgi:predicted membrane-bound spermidine synthase
MEAMPAEAELVNAVIGGELTVKDLWLRYLALGGTRTRQELQGYLGGELQWSTEDHDVLTRALNSPRQAEG